MARITERLLVPTPVEAAFDHVADFTTSQRWDPLIVGAERLDSGDLGVGSRFRVHLRFGLLTVPFEYEITHYDRPGRVVLTTRGLAHEGEDDVRFVPAPGGGTEVTWNAEFALRGPGRLIDPALAVGFRRTGKAAVAGLERSLHSLVEDAS